MRNFTSLILCLVIAQFGYSSNEASIISCEDGLTRFKGASGSTYQLYLNSDGYNPNFDVRSGLNAANFLNLYMITRDKSGKLSSSLTGSQIFSEIIQHFELIKIRGVVGNWGWGTNLEQFNAMTRESVSNEDAAKQTWTGRQAAKYGFDRAEIISTVGEPGYYEVVRVLYTRALDDIYLRDLSKLDLESIDWFYE